jgi:soluble lytic murein transglycosylase-like protein
VRATVCALLAESLRVRRGRVFHIESTSSANIPANSPAANAVRTTHLPRRPFVVALAGALFLAAVEFTPGRALETPPLSAVIAAGAHPRPSLAAAAAAPAAVDSGRLEREILSRAGDRPLARLLGRHNADPTTAMRIARAIIKESRRLQVAPSLLTGMLLTENTRLEPDAVSSQGAIGLMQVMHFHAGEFDCESDDLVDVESNICHGARIFGRYLQRTGSVKRALLRYNGCVTSANTPNCHRYPAKVFRAAGQVRRDLFRYASLVESD